MVLWQKDPICFEEEPPTKKKKKTKFTKFVEVAGVLVPNLGVCNLKHPQDYFVEYCLR